MRAQVRGGSGAGARHCGVEHMLFNGDDLHPAFLEPRCQASFRCRIRISCQRGRSTPIVSGVIGAVVVRGVRRSPERGVVRHHTPTLGYKAMHFVVVSSQKPSTPPSRPKPDCFIPPNGPVRRGNVALIANTPVRT